MRAKGLIAILGLALLATCLAAALAWGGRALGSEKTPSDAASQAKSGATASAPAETAPAEEEPRVVRWVCTDRLCGGCDGDCSRHGHVATHKDGHCACTPSAGSALDRATRKAFEGREKKP
jgi:hypothetical protein